MHLAGKRMSKALVNLRNSLEQALLSDNAVTQAVSPGGHKIKTAKMEIVRDIFNEGWAPDATDPVKRADARRKAFSRARNEGETKGLIKYRELNSEDFLWFCSSPEF